MKISKVPTHRLFGIEAGRGLAAFLVIGIHASDHVWKNNDIFPLGGLFSFGHAGVDFFFVLSGFIIMHVHGNDIGRSDRIRHYIRRRFTRVFPLYWAISIVSLALTAAGHQAGLLSFTWILSSALLLPTSYAPIVGVAWTLQHEMLFYTAFAILVYNQTAGLLVFGAWLALLLYATLLPGPGLGIVSGMFNLHFFFGMGAAWLLRRTMPAPWLLMAVGIVGFFAIGLAENLALVRSLAVATHMGYAVTSAVSVLGLVEAERQGLIRVHRFLTNLGASSYSLYLTHMISIGIIWQIAIAAHVEKMAPLWVQFGVLLCGGIAVGWIVHVHVEKPMTTLARRWTERR